MSGQKWLSIRDEILNILKVDPELQTILTQFVGGSPSDTVPTNQLIYVKTLQLLSERLTSNRIRVLPTFEVGVKIRRSKRDEAESLVHTYLERAAFVLRTHSTIGDFVVDVVDDSADFEYDVGEDPSTVLGTLSLEGWYFFNEPTPSIIASVPNRINGGHILGYVYQNKLFFAETRWWLFYTKSNVGYYRTSLDGKAWGNEIIWRSSLVGSSADFALLTKSYLDADFSGPYTFIHYCVAPGAFPSSVFYRRGVLNSDGTIAWSAAEQTIDTPNTDSRFAEPGVDVVDVNQDGTGLPFVSYEKWATGGGTPRPAIVNRSSTNDGTWVTASGHPFTLATEDLTWTHLVSIPGVSDGSVFSARAYVLYGSNAFAVRGRMWDGSSWGAQEVVDDAANPGGADASGIAFLMGLRAPNEDIHWVGRDLNDGSIRYRKRTFSSGTWSTVELLYTPPGGGTGQSPSLVLHGTEMYVFWVGIPKVGRIYYMKHNGTKWLSGPAELLDESTTGWIADALHDCLVTHYDYSDKIALVYSPRVASGVGNTNLKFFRLEP